MITLSPSTIEVTSTYYAMKESSASAGGCGFLNQVANITGHDLRNVYNPKPKYSSIVSTIRSAILISRE
jgi:hypothetical protein